MLNGFGDRARHLDKESKSGLPPEEKEAATSSLVSQDSRSLGRWGMGYADHHAAKDERASERIKKR